MSRLTVWLHKLGPSMTPCNFELGTHWFWTESHDFSQGESQDSP